MARKLILQNLMKLAQGIGANPSKFMGTRTNINFLGKGPTRNPLFQQPLDFLGPEGRGITAEALGDQSKLISAIEDAMGYATAGKLNPIQTEMLSGNLKGIYDILHPPVLPSASVTPIAPGIEGLRRFPKESHKFFGRPLKDKDFAEIDELVKRGRLPETGPERYNRLTGAGETGTVDFGAAMIARTGMSRAVARQILLQDTRLNLTDRAISSLKLSKDLGKGKIGSDPLDMMKLLYKPSSMHNYDEFLNAANIRPGMNAKDIATRILAEVELSPNVRYAEGGLAEIMQAPRSGYAQGIGPVGERQYNPVPEGTDWLHTMPVIDPNILKLMREYKKRHGLARILEV